MDRAQLFETLSNLPTATFERLLIAVDMPRMNRAGASAKIGDQVSAFLEWADSSLGPGWEAIAHHLAELNRCEFDSYLRSLVATYEKWWEHYTLTDAIGKVEPPEKPSVFDFGLMVQTITKEQDDANPRQEKQEKTERLPVLAGIRKYADDHVLLVGRPGSGKSTALIRLLLEEANACLSNSGLLDSYQAISRENASHPIPPAPLEKGGEAVKVPLFKGDLGGSSRASRSIENDVSTSIPSGREEPERVPVLVELRYWEHSIEGLIQGFLQRHGLTLDGPTLSTLLGQGRFLLLVDGLNELPSEDARTQLSGFRRNHPKLPMIFTTRDLGLGGDLGIEKKLEMQPLTEAQMKEFIRAYVPDQAEAMLRQLNDRLREFGQTPLLLWMLCGVFQQSPNRQMPTNLAEVFRIFTKGYAESAPSKHDVAALKGDVRPLSDRRLWKDALKALAALMMQGETPVDFRVAIHRTEAERELSKIFVNEKFPVRDILDDLLKYHLLQNRTTDQLEFRHQLIQEYYAAEHLLQLLPKLSDEQLKRDYLNLLKWTEHIALLLALVNEEAQALRVVKLAMDDVDLMLGARLAGEVKASLQPKTVGWIDDREIPIDLKVNCWATSHSEAAIPGLLQALQHQDSDVRFSAAEALGNIGSEAAIPDLLQALQDQDSSVRRSAAEDLGKMGSEAAIPGLLQALQDQDWVVRRNAAESLGKMGSEAAIPGLLQALQDQNWYVRMSAAADLGNVGSAATITDLWQLHLRQPTGYLKNAISATQDRYKFYNYEIWQGTMPQGQAVSLYCSYAPADEALQTQLAKHLTLLERQGIITSWSSHQILPGSDRTQTIHQQLNTADIILLLISPDAIADDTCYHLEIQRAIERHQSGEARVIPILLRPVDWQGAPFSQLDVLPKNQQPVTTWPNPDEAFQEIAEAIRQVAMEIRREKENSDKMDAL